MKWMTSTLFGHMYVHFSVSVFPRYFHWLKIIGLLLHIIYISLLLIQLPVFILTFLLSSSSESIIPSQFPIFAYFVFSNNMEFLSPKTSRLKSFGLGCSRYQKQFCPSDTQMDPILYLTHLLVSSFHFLESIV